MRRLVALVVVLFVLAPAPAWGFWSADAAGGASGRAVALTVNQGATPAVSVSGQAVTVSWSAGSLSSGQGVTGYEIKRYDAGTGIEQTVLTACTGTVVATTCTESSVPVGSWAYTVTPRIGAHWRGVESAPSATATVVPPDSIAPTNALSLTSVTGNARLTGTTLYYRGSAAGSFRVTNAVTDSGSGPASSTTAALGGSSAGWTHTASTVASPTGGPYESGAFSWAAGTTSAPTETVTGRDVAGNAAVTTLSFVNDSTMPTAGSISYPNTTQASTSVSVTFTSGTDAGSGLGTRLLQRRSAPLTGSTCGTYSAFATVTGGTNPASPFTDATSTGNCYQYQYVVSDNVGNTRVNTSTNVVKIGTPCTAGSQTVAAVADAWVDQAAPTQNKGTDSALYVMSKNANANRRALVRFTLPTVPANCSVSVATLNVHNQSPTTGRTIDVYQSGAAWTENGVTWTNQPATSGTAVGSTTTGSAGNQAWIVTALVQAQYAGTNNGFVLRDRTEGAAASPQQSYRSREGGTLPSLVVSWS